MLYSINVSLSNIQHLFYIVTVSRVPVNSEIVRHGMVNKTVKTYYADILHFRHVSL